MYLKRCIAGALAAAMLVLPVWAFAGQPEAGQQRGGEAVAAPARRRPAAPAAGVNEAVPGLAQRGPGGAASPAELEGMRGARLVSTAATLSGTLSDNSATQVATGNNVIQSGSFSNAAGLPVVIQNSGANVLIQNATVLNLELK